jgi:hypothetical protein
MGEIHKIAAATAIAVSFATLIATTGSDAAETPAPPRGYCLLHNHGGGDCSFTSKAQCEATAFEQGAECYPDNGEVYLASWCGHCFAQRHRRPILLSKVVKLRGASRGALG